MLDRGSALARGIERAHHRLRVHARMRIQRDELSARAHTSVHVSRLLLALREREQRAHVCMRELVAPVVEPVRELVRLVEMKTIEEGTGVEPHHAIGNVRCDRRTQIVQIATHLRRVEEQAIAGRDDRIIAQRRTKHVHGEVEQTSRVHEVPLGPEQRHGAITGQRLRPRRDDHGQQRDAVTLCRRAGEQRVTTSQARTTEQLNSDHGVWFTS